MISELKKRLASVLWIGGATDSGKSTVAKNLSLRFGVPVYQYDKADAEQTEKIAGIVPEVDRFLKASMEERWVHSTPQMMLDFLLLVFPHRFQLVIEDLLEMPGNQAVIVEGFGLVPELVHPVLSSPHQAVWFVPTDKFKLDSMIRRGKPSFASLLGDPEKARKNLFDRDGMLADYYRRQVQSHGYILYEVDGSRSAEEMTDLVASHFSEHLATLA